MNDQSYFVSCPKGLEELLEKELKINKITKFTQREGGCYFRAAPMGALNLLIQSRIASRIFKQVGKFHLKEQDDLYKKIVKMDWSTVFDLKQTFKINVLFDRDSRHKFKNSLFLSQLTKDAICDQFKEKYGERPNVQLSNPDISILVRLERDDTGYKAILFIDICGKPLSNRGYRDSSHPAPIRENLAAGIIMFSEWNPEKEIFIDSMCGSGTFLIEAALIKNRLPPSALHIRSFVENESKPWAFLHQRWFTPGVEEEFMELIEKEYNQIIETFNKEAKCTIYGYDIEFKSVKSSLLSIENARFPKGLVHVEKGDACKIKPPKGKVGVVVCNPPYGKRLNADLERLYFEYGENLKQEFKDFRAYIITGNLPLRKKISLQTSARILLFNGDIECRLLRYNLY